MKKTIKYKVLASVGKHPKGVDRKTLQQFIFKAQGKKDMTYRQGYYAQGIQAWELDGLFNKRERGGKFILSKRGKEYLGNPTLINTLIRAERKARLYDFYRKRYSELLYEFLLNDWSSSRFKLQIKTN
jgi:hypothetical protein